MKNNDTNKFVDIVNAIGEPEFCHCLLAYFQHFIEFDSASAIHYRKDHVPELLYADLFLPTPPSHHTYSSWVIKTVSRGTLPHAPPGGLWIGWGSNPRVFPQQILSLPP